MEYLAALWNHLTISVQYFRALWNISGYPCNILGLHGKFKGLRGTFWVSMEYLTVFVKYLVVLWNIRGWPWNI